MTLLVYPRDGFAKLRILSHEVSYALVLFQEYVSFWGLSRGFVVLPPFSEAVASTKSIAVIDWSY